MKPEARKFVYSLKLHDGRLLRVIGVSAEDAARRARVSFAKVKRHMPVKALPTRAERKRMQVRLAALKQSKKERMKTSKQRKAGRI